MNLADIPQYGPCRCQPVSTEHQLRHIISRWVDSLIDAPADPAEGNGGLVDIATLASDIHDQFLTPRH